MLTGRIFSVEEFATFDGPGIRMTVFLKGCPLRCTWCHNPEGQSFPMEFLRSPNGCTGCGACLDAGQRERGTRCLTEASISACPRNLVRRCGEDITSVQLIDQIMKNARLLSGGGVTFSGGEPLAQLPFLLECLRLLEGRTCFLIAHRPSTIRRADRIFVVGERGIVESGTYDELMKKRGVYWSVLQ